MMDQQQYTSSISEVLLNCNVMNAHISGADGSGPRYQDVAGQGRQQCFVHQYE